MLYLAIEIHAQAQDLRQMSWEQLSLQLFVNCRSSAQHTDAIEKYPTNLLLLKLSDACMCVLPIARKCPE